jgi:hypothetical protein
VQSDTPPQAVLPLASASQDFFVARWNMTVIHPSDPAQDTVVCCLTDDGSPVALMLSAELREALGLILVDPDGEMDQPSELVVYRAEHDSIGLGTYLTPGAAKDHCQQLLHRTDPHVETTWTTDSEDDGSPESLCFTDADGDLIDSGYAITPIAVNDTYDPDGDE